MRPVVVDGPRRGVDVLEPLDFREERLGEARRLDAVPAVVREGGLAADDGIRVLVRLGEDRRERAVDRVGEDERAAHQRDAEHDRQAGQRRAKLPPREALERDAVHRRELHGVGRAEYREKNDAVKNIEELRQLGAFIVRTGGAGKTHAGTRYLSSSIWPSATSFELGWLRTPPDKDASSVVGRASPRAFDPSFDRDRGACGRVPR